MVITDSLYGGIRGNAKRLRELLVQDGRWDKRRIELEIVFLFGSQVECINVIFNFRILLRFLYSCDSVLEFCPADEVRSRLNKVALVTWRIMARLLRREVVDIDSLRTAMFHKMGHFPRL